MLRDNKNDITYEKWEIIWHEQFRKLSIQKYIFEMAENGSGTNIQATSNIFPRTQFLKSFRSKREAWFTHGWS